MILFILTRGWRALLPWQRWYLVTTCVAVPFLWYSLIGIEIAGTEVASMKKDPEYIYELIVVELWNLIVYVGIGSGLVSLVRMIAEWRQSLNRSSGNS